MSSYPPPPAAPPGAPPPAAQPTYSAPPGAAPSHAGRWAAVGAIVVVVIVVLGLGFLNVIPGFHLGGNGSGGGGGGGAPTYAVNFTESGLPASTSWSLTLGGATVSSSTTVISFAEPNGTYSFSIGCPRGYTSSSLSGTLTVAGGTVSQLLDFFTGGPCPSFYSVTFMESGLPSGTSWSVTLSGTTLTETILTASVFQELNGSYPYTVGSVAGYNSAPSLGTVVVAGTATTQAIVFTPSSGGTAVDSAQAMTIGASTVQGYNGQSWYPVLAISFTQPTTSTQPLGTFTSGCTYSGPSTVSVPGFSGSLTSGDSAFWFLIYNQTGYSSNHVAVTVSDGTGSVLGSITGSSCSITQFVDLNGVTLLTSAQAVAAANSGGNVTAFVNSHGTLYAEMALAGVHIGGSTVYIFTLAWATCSFINPTPGSGIELMWSVDAQNGISVGSGTVTSC